MTEPLSRLVFTWCSLSLAAIVAASCGCDRPVPVPFKRPVPAGVRVEIHAVAKSAGPSTIRGKRPGSGEDVFLRSPPIIVTADIATVAQADLEIHGAKDAAEFNSQPAIEFVLTPTGAEKMRAATSNPAVASVAVVINGSVVSVPNVLTPISGSFQISGSSDDPEFAEACATLTGSQ